MAFSFRREEQDEEVRMCAAWNIREEVMERGGVC